ncbi:hypothetical protein SDC9_178341 [bioreactor metagenome]|uniref:GS catalytic domain-containing protein n=1 Tax=bioreactor metagenome TaxID=1076179 RepID=A0A645GWY1_9ZZZZ
MDALPYFVSDDNISLFTKYGVFSETEIRSRYEILLENYYKTINIEALTMVDLIKKEVTSYLFDYQLALSELANGKKALSLGYETESAKLNTLSALGTSLFAALEKLEGSISGLDEIPEVYDKAVYAHDSVVANMGTLRAIVDELETIIPKKYWNLPTYGEILYSVK